MDFSKKPEENYQQYIWRMDELVQSGKYQNWNQNSTQRLAAVLPGFFPGFFCALHSGRSFRYDRWGCGEENRYRQRVRFKAGHGCRYRFCCGLPDKTASGIGYPALALYLDRRHRIHKGGEYRSRIYLAVSMRRKNE